MSFLRKLPQIYKKEATENGEHSLNLKFADQSEINHPKPHMRPISEKKKFKSFQNNVRKRSMKTELNTSNFAKLAKGLILNIKDQDRSCLEQDDEKIKRLKSVTYFNAKQKQTIQMALDIVNARKREKENESLNMQKKDSIVETLNKTRDLFWLKTGAKIINQEIDTLENRLAKDKEDIGK